MNVSIQHPEWLQPIREGRVSYGYNQEWFESSWKQLAGCGPTTATQLIAYSDMRSGRESVESLRTSEQALALMDKVWPYVTPRPGGGLYKTTWFKVGVERYLAEHGLSDEVEMLRVYPFFAGRPSLKTTADFITKGLLGDSPVAFLNRHRGGEVGLETWHWVPLISLEQVEGDYIGTVYDEEIAKQFSLKNWLQRSTLGGGFLYLSH